MKRFWPFILLFLLVGCHDKVIQYPVAYGNDSGKFMEFSQDLNKQILEEDNELIERYIEETQGEYTRTSYGFWISNSGHPTPEMAKTGDVVIYDYEVRRFDDEVVYSREENGNQNVMIGRSDVPRGVQTGLQLIEKGDSAVLLLPSFLAYGGYGDRDRVGGNEPLIFEIYILDIQKNR